MIIFLIQAAILIFLAFVLGCIVGSFLRRLFDKPVMDRNTATQTTSSTTAIVSNPASSQIGETASKVKSTTSARPARSTAKPAIKKASAKKTSIKKNPTKKSSVKKTIVEKSSTKDNLKQIKGIGPQNESKLNGEGIATFAHIAKWTAKDQREMGKRLSFPGRIEREQWVKQAKVLARGGQTQFSKRVTKGQIDSSKGRIKKAGRKSR